MVRLFVYGTLKRGCSNHEQLASEHYLGPAHSAPGWRLYDLGDYPGMVRDPSDQDGVPGELWEVSPAALASLDRFEGVPDGLYAREAINLRDEVQMAETYVFLGPLNDRPALSGTWQA